MYEGKIMEESTQEELLKYFVGWEDAVQQLVQVRVKLDHLSHILITNCSVSRNLFVGPSRQSDLCHNMCTTVLHCSVTQ